MLTAVRKFFQAPAYEGDPEKTLDARTTHRVSVALLGLGIFSIPMIFLLTSPVREFALAATGLGIIIWLTAIHLIKREKLTLVKIIILIVNTINLYTVIFATGGLAQSTVFTMLFLLSLANLLFPRRGAIVYGSTLLLLVLVLFALDQAGLVPEPAIDETGRSVFLIFLFTLISIATVLSIASANFLQNLEELRKKENDLREQNVELDQLKNNLEIRVTDRTTELEKRAKQLEAISSVARSTASLQNLEELLPAITELVSERFDFYHTGIFLLDEDQEFANLRAANSEGGKRMLVRQHKLKTDTSSIVGFATSQGQPRIALDVGTDAVYFDNPDLPDTRSEMALPLRVGGRVIGALDVQSTEPNAFTEEDVATLSTLADQIAIAIENTRLFSEAREALKASEETFSQYVQQEWSSFARQTKISGYKFDGIRTTPLDEKETQNKVKDISKTGRLSLEKAPRELSIPIRFRGQAIGILDVKSRNKDRKWTSDDIALIEAAVERTALALENARLVETSQLRASRERTIGEISTKIGAVSNIEAIMQAAVEELGRRIGGAAEVTIELGDE
ncbi:MAG TPA: GAF domain-containing protein [Anaerolineales bacterium]|nr:GAF domain-containing protein [Anaerolineales bacterium]